MIYQPIYYTKPRPHTQGQILPNYSLNLINILFIKFKLTYEKLLNMTLDA